MATLQNIGKLKYRGNDGLWHPLPVVVQDTGGGVSTISGKGAPTSETQGKVNQLYRDEDTQKLYICTATDGGYTWSEVSGGGSVDIDATLTKAGQAADAKAAGDAIGKKIDKAQGTGNAGKILGIGEDGNVTPQDKPVQALAGAVAPTTDTAGVVGQEYYVIVNNALAEMYVCTAVANGTYTWGRVEFGAEIDDTSTEPNKVWSAEKCNQLSEDIANLQTSGLTTAQVNALDGMFKIASFTEDPTAAYTAFKAAFSISGSGDSGDSGEETPGDTTEAVLPTDGLADFFDMRNTTLGTVANGGYGLNGSNGGYLYGWSSALNGIETDDYGISAASKLTYVGTELGQNVTVCTLSYDADGSRNLYCWMTHAQAKTTGAVNVAAKYVDTAGDTQTLANNQVNGATEGYNAVAMSISPEAMKVYINGVLQLTVEAADIENFDKWVNDVSVQSGYADCSGVAVAIYNKTLSQVEVVEVGEYFKTMEVSA